MTDAVRALRRLRYETKDWCKAVNETHSPRTHAARETAQHSRRVWNE